MEELEKWYSKYIMYILLLLDNSDPFPCHKKYCCISGIVSADLSETQITVAHMLDNMFWSKWNLVYPCCRKWQDALLFKDWIILDFVCIYTNHIFCIHSSVDGNLGCFHSWQQWIMLQCTWEYRYLFQILISILLYVYLVWDSCTIYWF